MRDDVGRPRSLFHATFFVSTATLGSRVFRRHPLESETMRSVLLRPRKRRARGFTLPELMAVVAIIGVMGAIAMATMSRSGDAQNSGAYARSLEYAMMNARSSAI